MLMYPIGISGEMFALYNAWNQISNMPDAEKPLSIQMPNTLNFAVDWGRFIIILTPPIYIYFAPGLF